MQRKQQMSQMQQQIRDSNDEAKGFIKFNNMLPKSPREMMMKKISTKEGDKKRDEDSFCQNGKLVESTCQGVMHTVSYSYNQNAKGLGAPNAKKRQYERMKYKYSSDDYGEEEEKKVSKSQDAESPLGSDAELHDFL